MPPTADVARIRSLLGSEYGIHVETTEPGERGTVAETWVVTSPQAAFFVKAVPIGRYAELLERSLPIQQRLWDAGFTRMNRPIPTTSGALTSRLHGHLVAVYARIDGVSSQDYPFEPYVDMLAALHGTSVAVDEQVETFAVDTTALVVPFIAAVRAAKDPDALVAGLRETVDRLGPAIERDMQHARRLRPVLAARRDLELVITHYDAPGNVMIEPDGRLVLVDWDELLLAPRERDTWSHLVDPDQAPRFLARYRRTVPDYEPDVDAMRHYLLKWYFEEIEGLGGPVLDRAAAPDVRAQWSRWFQGAVPALNDTLRRLESGERPWLAAPVDERP